MYRSCTLCPRNCQVNRAAGKTGFCGMPATVQVARASLHMWEEPCISGINGSGTVFFTGCNLKCVFCQNHSIALGGKGKEVSVEKLAELFLMLQEKGAHNINLVTPSHYIPGIAQSLCLAKDQGLTVPIVYNTSGYDSVNSLALLEGLVDIYLPDFKYVSDQLSRRYSHAPDYFQVAKESLAEMFRQVGDPVFEDFLPDDAKASLGIAFNTGSDTTSGASSDTVSEIASDTDCEADSPANITLMKRGIIVRHLLLPGCVEDSKAVIRYLYETYGNDIFISIMNQYTSLPHVAAYPELNRKVTEAEYDEVVDYAIDLGVEQGFIQEGDTAQESFIPEFDFTGLL